MRRTPEVVFLLDKGLERGTTVLGLLGRLEADRLVRGDVPEGTGGDPAAAAEATADEESGADDNSPVTHNSPVTENSPITENSHGD